MSNSDGGQAFPRPASEYTKNGTCPDGNDPIDSQEGMTLRDWFAGQALMGMMSNMTPEDYDVLLKTADALGSTVNDLAAERAYALAGAMIAVRSREE